MKQKDLGEQSKIPRSTISYYESNKSEPTLTSLINLANLFKITIDDLVKIRLTEGIIKEKELNRDTNSNKKFSSSAIFAKKLKEFRLKLKFNQKDLGDTIGVSGISFYESKKREPQLSSLIKISDFFNISIDELVSEDIDIYTFTQTEIEFFKKVDFNCEYLTGDDDFLNLLYNLKKYYLKQSEKLTELIENEIPYRIKEIDSIIDFIKHKEYK